MTTPTADAFAALARSSPWRWSTLRFRVRWSGGPTGHGAVRAWLRRPDLLRVETLDGALVQVVREADAVIPEPALLRADGLVDLRPGDRWSYDAPMFQNYHWVAMLDPLELAEVAVDEVVPMRHGDRPAWEAVVRTRPDYEPRCGCCPLLRSREVDLLEYADYPQNILAEYPDAHRARLDLATGVCVFTEEIGGLAPGPRHDVRIEAVDEPMDDELFAEPPQPRVRRGWGWAQYPGPT